MDKREWGGTRPEIEIEYDKIMEFMLNFKITYPRNYPYSPMKFEFLTSKSE